jgi:cell wall-associated NlpC family hydrolase
VRPRHSVIASALALALGAGTVAGCGSGETAATAADAPVAKPPAADVNQAVDDLIARSNPRAVDPDAGAMLDPEYTAGMADDELPQPLTDAEIRAELEGAGLPAGERAAITPDGLAVAPLGAPEAVKTIIEAGNKIARLPYRYGGGHGTFVDTAYDCSASISYAFAAAGLVDRTMVSGELANWGAAGAGRWITIYANGGHVYMYVAGLRFDTSGLRQTGSRWIAEPRDGSGFTVRHPVGL